MLRTISRMTSLAVAGFVAAGRSIGEPDSILATSAPQPVHHKRVAEPEAAVAIVRARLPEESVLLMRRTVRAGDSWSGQWSFPGGRSDPSDRSPLETALRELWEECGIRLTAESLEAALANRLARRRVGRFLLVAPFVFSIERELATVPCPEETAEARWIPMSVLRDPARHHLQCVPGFADEMRYP